MWSSGLHSAGDGVHTALGTGSDDLFARNHLRRNGAVLPGATVTITDPQTGFTRTVQTESDGTYQFLQLHPTVYVVEVSATGFAKLKREDARLQVNTPATMNFTMQVSATKVEIEVTTEAPLVNTQERQHWERVHSAPTCRPARRGPRSSCDLEFAAGCDFYWRQLD